MQRPCTFDGCDRPLRARGLCHTHYMRFWKHGDANVVMERWPAEPTVRVFSRLSFSDNRYAGTLCLEFGKPDNTTGYGVVEIGGKRHLVHRWLYERWVGPIPDGLEIDHLCRNRACANPLHLEPVTHAENIRRGESPSAHQARQTHCIHGHEFTPENTYIRKDNGARMCRACARDRRIARKRANA